MGGNLVRRWRNYLWGKSDRRMGQKVLVDYFKSLYFRGGLE